MPFLLPCGFGGSLACFFVLFPFWVTVDPVSFVELFVPFLRVVAPVLWCLSSCAVPLGAVHDFKVYTHATSYRSKLWQLIPQLKDAKVC